MPTRSGGGKADEVAEFLDANVASVNKALQRARATVAAQSPAPTTGPQPMDEAERALVARYLDAFERFDIEPLVTLLHMDATLSMAPYELWMRGPGEIRRWLLGPGRGCRGSRLIPVSANGSPAFGQYRPDPEGCHSPWALHVLDVSDGQVTALNTFLDTERLFPLFGLSPRLDGDR